MMVGDLLDSFEVVSHHKKSISKRKIKDLSWRLPPSESLADYEIILSSPPVGKATQRKKTKYSVHKCQVAVPPRNLTFFTELFNDPEEKKKAFVEIEFEIGSARAAFPVFLDFVYGLDLEIKDVHTAVALRWLCTYFGSKECFDATNEWIREELASVPASSVAFAREADLYKDEKMIATAVNICGEHLASINCLSIRSLSPKLFCQVVDSYINKDDECLSSIIANYLENTKHAKDIDTDIAQSLTTNIKSISAEASLSLLRFALRYQLKDIEKLCVTAASKNRHIISNLVSPSHCLGKKRKSAAMEEEIPLEIQNEMLKAALDLADKEITSLSSELTQAKSTASQTQFTLQHTKSRLQHTESRLQRTESREKKMRGELTCCICKNLFKDPIASACGHVLCRHCARTLIRNASFVPRCPTCRAPLHLNDVVTCFPIKAVVDSLNESYVAPPVIRGRIIGFLA
mmetsp:Transcript_15138/g.22728  ORF Transcript_15138/g.22728 Transcript_15138/m.22728 type:complete len:461 (+) Transcript_15138:885-2267(+)